MRVNRRPLRYPCGYRLDKTAIGEGREPAMRRDLRGEPQDAPADRRPLSALRTLPAIAMTVIAVGACRSQPTPQPIAAADGEAVFREGCDGAVCWTEGRDENGRLLSRHGDTAEGSTTWVYEPPGAPSSGYMSSGSCAPPIQGGSESAIRASGASASPIAAKRMS